MLQRFHHKQWIVLLAVAWLCLGPLCADAEIDAIRTIHLKQPVVQVVDGDTFEVDLNGNGRLDLPEERVRMLYIDTPELRDSPKGQDVAHGLPAKAALEALLGGKPLDLTISRGNAHDKYGRTLAVVTAGGRDVGLTLIRQGHSPFDTRFVFPSDYAAYTAAEAEAFDAKRGIWSEAGSRQGYLSRLRKEGRTPQSSRNPLYVAGVSPANATALGQWIGKYVTVEGKVVSVRPLKGGAHILHLQEGSTPPLAVFANRFTARNLNVSAWPARTAVRAEGFVQSYKEHVQLTLHYGKPR